MALSTECSAMDSRRNEVAPARLPDCHPSRKSSAGSLSAIIVCPRPLEPGFRPLPFGIFRETSSRVGARQGLTPHQTKLKVAGDSGKDCRWTANIGESTQPSLL